MWGDILTVVVLMGAGIAIGRASRDKEFEKLRQYHRKVMGDALAEADVQHQAELERLTAELDTASRGQSRGRQQFRELSQAETAVWERIMAAEAEVLANRIVTVTLDPAKKGTKNKAKPKVEPEPPPPTPKVHRIMVPKRRSDRGEA